MGPLVGILGKSLVRILDSRIKVANLVIEHLLKVGLMEILGDSFPKSHRE